MLACVCGLCVCASADKRYKRVGDIPDTVLSSMEEDKVFSPGFSIKGERVEGRPAYLDFQVRSCAGVMRCAGAATQLTGA